MKDTNQTPTNCAECQERLPDLLLDPNSVPAPIKAHSETCTICSGELGGLLATYAALDEWTAPEPSAYFDTRLRARVREASTAPPEGLFERMRSFVLFSTGRHLRPALAGALALALIVSGGSFLEMHGLHMGGDNKMSATVNDLKLLDNNAQALQQMDLLDDASDDDPPSS